MTQLLQKAIEAVNNLNVLPEDEQNAIATQIIQLIDLNKPGDSLSKAINSKPALLRTPLLANRKHAVDFKKEVIELEADV